MPEQRGRDRQSGFTLLELLTTIAVVTVIAAIALPSYRSIIRAQRMTTQIYDFNAALNLARSEAVKRGVVVTVCPSSDLAACTGANWEQGWIVFTDQNNNQTIDGTDEILRATPALVSGYTLRGSSGTSPSMNSYVTINPKGAVSATGMFVLCETSSGLSPSRAVLVNNSGRISMATVNDTTGVAIGAAGTDITTCTPS